MNATEQALEWCHYFASRGVTISQDEMRQMFMRPLLDLERDRERLLNVLEHCALPDGTRPEKQHEVAAMVVKEYRAEMAQQKGGG